MSETNTTVFFIVAGVGRARDVVAVHVCTTPLLYIRAYGSYDISVLLSEEQELTQKFMPIRRYCAREVVNQSFWVSRIKRTTKPDPD